MPESNIPFTVAGGVVLVTGAAMGMGRLHALRAASEGAAVVILWDVDAAGLEGVAREVTALGARAVARAVDLADRAAIAEAARECRAEGALTLLINNAGIVRGAFFWEHRPGPDIALTMDVNALAPMYATLAFLPDMMAEGGGAPPSLYLAPPPGPGAHPPQRGF